MGRSGLLTPPEIIGIDGTEDPLTPADVLNVVEAVYHPWQATLALVGYGALDGWHRGHLRPASYGGSRDGFFFNCSPHGIHARYEGDPPRAGLITWTAAERLICDAATSATSAVLIEAVRAERALTAKLAGQHAALDERREHFRLEAAARRAWRDLIRADRGEPVQLDLFAEVA